MEPTTSDAALEKLAKWREGRTWVECIVSSRETSLAYRVVGVVSDFDDGILVGSSLDQCAATLPGVLFRFPNLVEIDGAGALHLCFPHADVRISEIQRKDVGHA